MCDRFGKPAAQRETQVRARDDGNLRMTDTYLDLIELWRRSIFLRAHDHETSKRKNAPIFDARTPRGVIICSSAPDPIPRGTVPSFITRLQKNFRRM